MVLASLTIGLWLAAPLDDVPHYRWGAGSKTGGFTKISNAIEDGLAKTNADFKIDIQTTKGSCENIKRLLGGELDFALVQYDVAAEAYKATQAIRANRDGTNSGHEHGGFMCKISADMAEGVDLRVVAALTDGAIHVLVRRPVRIDDFSALEGRSVYLGREGSGSFETSKVIVGAAGMTVDSLDLLQVGTSDAFNALRDESLLMMLRTTEAGDASISQVIADGVATVNPLPDEVLNRLIDGYPYYRVCQIDANTYPGMEYVVPTVCVSTVVLTTMRDTEDERTTLYEVVDQLLKAIRYAERDPEHDALHIQHQFRGFAERTPIPIHPAASAVEQQESLQLLVGIGIATIIALGIALLARRILRRRGVLQDPMESSLEGQLANPLIPFAGFLTIVILATFAVWSLEHDSNARVRTLTDSFWEMNMFATGNFDTESLKTSAARVIGAAATIGGLGLLAWFTAALTNIFARDQMRLWTRLNNHIVILNFREDMLQLIRLLRSPGPQRSRPIHIVVSDELPRRVRLQLAHIRGVTIYQRNPEVPEDLASLRIERAARVIVLLSDKSAAYQYHPLRIARAVHQICGKLSGHRGTELGKTGFSVAPPPAQAPPVAGDDVSPSPSLPVTVVEAHKNEPLQIFDPFAQWLIPIQERTLANHWVATACADPRFAEVFNNLVSFRDENSEVYTALLPEWFHGRTWRQVRRTVLSLEARAGVVPVGLYRAANGLLAYDAKSTIHSSPQRELQKRLRINPPLNTIIEPGDRVLAFAEDEADLREILQSSRRHLEAH